MLLRYSRKLFNRPFQDWLLFGMGLPLVFHFSFGITSSFAQEEVVYQGQTPEAVMEQFFAEANEGVVTRLGRVSIAGDYAIAGYIWGETGGFIVMERDEDRQWRNICGGGGALDGGHALVEFCDISLIDAQNLWNQYVEDGEAAGYVF